MCYMQRVVRNKNGLETTPKKETPCQRKTNSTKTVPTKKPLTDIINVDDSDDEQEQQVQKHDDEYYKNILDNLE